MRKNLEIGLEEVEKKQEDSVLQRVDKEYLNGRAANEHCLGKSNTSKSTMFRMEDNEGRRPVKLYIGKAPVRTSRRDT